MSKNQATCKWFLLLSLGVGGCFASTATLCSLSATYPQDYPPHPAPVSVSMSDPAACGIADYSQVLSYVIDAGASTNAAGGATGSIGASVRAGYYYQSNPPGTYFPPNIYAEASASAEIAADFTTSGPLRPGILTFTYSGTLSTATYSMFNGSASLSINDGSNTYSDGPEFCGLVRFPPVHYYCPSFTMPIELGSRFRVESAVSVDLNSRLNFLDFNNFGESGTFTLQELDGTPVDAILVTVPEPAAFALAGLALAGVCAYVRAHRRPT